MIDSPLRKQGTGKALTEDDIPLMKHEFRVTYGWISDEAFDEIPINELFEAWKFVNEERRKREEFRLISLKYMGVKNPK